LMYGMKSQDGKDSRSDKHIAPAFFLHFPHVSEGIWLPNLPIMWYDI
jgi:hypothetical protein